MKHLSFLAKKRPKKAGFRVGMRQAKRIGMSERNEKGINAGLPELLLAVHRGSEDEVRRLLAQGVNVNGTDGDGITPLMASAMNGQAAIARLLLAAGAYRDLFNTWGMTAHDIAAWHGYDALAALLDETAGGAETKT